MLNANLNTNLAKVTRRPMTEPVAYLNGEYVPISQARLSVFDLGVVAGASATEMARTFRHKVFRLEEHLDRLDRSLQFMGIQSGLPRAELLSICDRVVRQNAQLIPADHDLGLIIFITAGQNLTYLGRAGAATAKTPSVCVHTFPLPFELWVEKYETGLHLVTTSVKSMPDDVIDPTIKHRNRLHWQLADLEAKRIDPAAMALLTDGEGYLTETPTGNLCVVEGSTILTPERHVLKGISRDVVSELATSLGLTLAYTRITAEDLSRANEAFLASTPLCIQPITRFNQQQIGDGRPGPIFITLISAWSDLVDVDIIQQMRLGAKARLAEI